MQRKRRHKIMCRVTGHHQNVRTRALQRARRSRKLRQRIFAACKDGGRAVRNVRVVVDEHARVLLIAFCIRHRNDFAEQIRRCKRPHAADDSDCLFHVHVSL